MPPRTVVTARSRAFLLALAGLLGAACASSSDPADPSAPEPAADPGDAPVLPAAGVKFGWRLLKAPSKPGQVTTLTLVSENSREGKLMAAGRGQIPGGKVVDDRTAADLLAAFERQGFDRFAVRAAPDAGPPGATNVIWLDRGDGFESVFLLPGAVNVPETRDLPKVYEGLKALIVSVHGATIGATVTTGQGWSGDDMMKQRPGGAGK